jgi:Spy/CpxP family protein refolding chaperone
MQRLIWSFVAIMVAALTAISQPAHVRGHMGGPGMPRLDRLELTEAQEKQMKELRLTHQKKMVQIRSTIAQARLDLEAVRDAAAPDRAAVEKGIRAVSELELQAKLARTSFWFDLRGLLTEKQQEMWKEMPGKQQFRRHGPPPECRRGRCG